MQDKEELFEQLVSKAMAGEHSKFDYISSLGNLAAVRDYISACRSAASTFRGIANLLREKYLDQVSTDGQDLDLLLALKRFRLCEGYYDEEIRIAKDLIKEYRAYVFGGHFIDTLLGTPRAASDMVDFRTVPWSWF